MTDVLKPRVNQLAVETVNIWNNRIVGDLALPEVPRCTSLACDTVKPDAPLMPAGLLGPVTLQILWNN